MKNFRCSVMAVALALSISTVAFAGDLQGVGVAPPPPPPPPGGDAITATQPTLPNKPGDDNLSIAENTLIQLLTLIF